MTRKARAVLLQLGLFFTLGLATGMLPAAAGAPVAGSCISASVDEPILLPSGAEHPSGRLTLCVTRHFTPVTTLHRTYVDGRLIGLLQSRRGYSEGATDGPYMMFHRDTAGRLHLYAFATPAGSRMATYNLSAATARAGSSTMARGAAAGAGTLVLMANSGPASGR